MKREGSCTTGAEPGFRDFPVPGLPPCLRSQYPPAPWFISVTPQMRARGGVPPDPAGGAIPAGWMSEPCYHKVRGGWQSLGRDHLPHGAQALPITGDHGRAA